MIKTREVVDALMTYLDAGTTTNYLSQGPKQPSGAYCVVHPSGGKYQDVNQGSLGDHTADNVVSFQATSVGETTEQAIWVHDTISARLWSTALTVAAGVVTLPIWAVPGSQQPILRDDDIEPPLYYVTCRWVAHAIPTT